MRLVTYDAGQGAQPGAIVDDRVVPIDAPSLRALLHAGQAATAPLSPRAARPLEEVRLLPPVPDPDKVICMGLNFRDHAAEANQPIPEHPRWFAKFASTLVGDGADIVLPAAHPDWVDYEAELAVVIGHRAHRVTEADALHHVAGAMPFNDVSARDLQLQNPLWTSGKAIDTFAPCGPALVTLDEAGNLGQLALRTRVNTELLQNGRTDAMIFGVAQTIAWLSRTLTLLPGDVIAMGTPAGIGAVQNRFLRPGDTVAVEVEGLGTLTNGVVPERP